MTVLIILGIIVFLYWSLVPSQNQRMGINPIQQTNSNLLDSEPVILNFTKFTKTNKGFTSDGIVYNKSRITIKSHQIIIEDSINGNKNLQILRKSTPKPYEILFVCSNNINVILNSRDEVKIIQRNGAIDGIRYIQ